MRNIELKARLRDRSHALAVCARIGAEPKGDIHQVDTYFPVANGRMKLRECDSGEDYLVYYRRPDVADSKASDYFIEPASSTLKETLAAALGTMGVVDKVRTLWLWRNVRIHIDRVVGLGDYLEFEAVLSDEFGDQDGFAKLSFLRTEFEIAESDLETGSYLDLLSTYRDE
ncbi:MAG: hypothetical protein AMXMBFR82_41230 [Candidatus Hydrogenedentota bacterium]